MTKPIVVTPNAVKRFWAKVNKTDSCWLWTGAHVRNGYGQIWDGHNTVLAHRFSYTMHIGPIPSDKLVCHTCDTPPCINPKHLWLGTSRDNIEDAITKGRITILVSTGFCTKGHPMTNHVCKECMKVLNYHGQVRRMLRRKAARQ